MAFQSEKRVRNLRRLRFHENCQKAENRPYQHRGRIENDLYSFTEVRLTLAMTAFERKLLEAESTLRTDLTRFRWHID
jgi:hypothetical protein